MSRRARRYRLGSILILLVVLHFALRPWLGDPRAAPDFLLLALLVYSLRTRPGKAAVAGVVVALFLAPDVAQIEAGREIGAAAVELHTGQYALAKPGSDRDAQLEVLETAAAAVRRCGMKLHAGHGLNYQNVGPVAGIEDMAELNIGHSIIARAVMVGLQRAVREMKELIRC